MKKFTFLVLVSLFVFLIQSTAQVVEGFDYTSGEVIENNSGGSAWKGPWTKVGGDDAQVLAAGGVSSLALGKKTSNNHLQLTQTGGSGGERFYRSLATPVTDDGNAYYLSYFMKTTWEGEAGANGSVNLVMLLDSATYGAGGPGGQLVQFGRVYGSENIGILKGGANQKIEGTNASDGHFVVVKIFMSGDAENEKFYMFVDPDPSAEPDTANADLKNEGFNLNGGFNSIGFKIEGGGALNGELDEIRFGTMYDQVAPSDLISAPTSANEMFNGAVGSDLAATTGEGNGWGAAWSVITGSNLTVAEGGIENMNLLKQTSGNKTSISFSGAKQRVTRALGANFPDDGSTYYLSFSTKSTIGTLNTASFMMLSNENFAATGPNGQLVQIGKSYNSNLIGVGSGSSFDNSAALADEAHFIVAKIMTSGDAGADSVAIFVDPDLASEPTNASAGKSFGTALNNGFSAIGIKVEGDGNGILTTEYDDIYLGFDYASVIPDDFLDVAPPSTIAKERFIYTGGESLNNQGEMAAGWSGAWEAENDPDSSMIANAGLRLEELGFISKAPSVVITSPGTNNRYQRLFEEPVTIDKGEFWFSVQMAVSGVINNTAASFILADTSKANNQQVIIGKQYGNMNLFATGQAGSGVTQTNELFVNGEAQWVVGHMVATDGKWNMDLWVNPDAGTMPVEASANIQKKAYNGVTFNGVVIRSEGGEGCNFHVDDIYIGYTYESVVPEDLTALPPAPGGAMDKFNYNAGTDSLRGLNGGSGFAEGYTILSGSNQPISAKGITNYFELKETKGPSLHFPLNSKARVVRKLDGEYGDYGRSFWLGWWQHNYGTGGGNVANMVLADVNTYGSGGAGGQLLQIGKSFDGTIKMVGASQAVAEGVAWDTAHFYALYIETNGSAEPDNVYLFVDPDLSVAPDLANANAMAKANLTNWNAVGFKVEGPDGVGAFFDDVMLGSSYADIIPDDLTDVEPPEEPVAAFELFDYAVGGDLESKDGGEGWSSAWVKKSGVITIAEGSIMSDRVTPTGNKASIVQSSTNTVYAREFKDRFGGKASSVWMSFLYDMTQKSVGNKGLVSVAIGDDNVLSLGGVAGLNRFAAVYNGTATVSSTNIEATGMNWVVVRMDIDGTDAVDNAVVWLNPSADAIPSDDNALFNISDININNGFDALKVEAIGVQSLSTFFDEFRIGFSYRDISNKFGSDDPNLIAYEPFNYDVDATLEGSGGVNAFWDDSWQNIGNMSTNTALITEGSMQVNGFESIGNKATLSYLVEGTQIRIIRKLAFPLENNGESYWASFMMESDNIENVNNVANMSFNNTNISAKAGQRVGFGRIYATSKVGIITPPNNSSTLSDVEDLGQKWIVIKVQTTGDAAPDTMWMWINPNPNAEPDTALADIMKPTVHMKEGIDAIMLKVEGAGGGQAPLVVQFDEIRLAKNYASLNPLSSSIDRNKMDEFGVNVYPNPFSDRLNIVYSLERKSDVKVMIYDINGRVLKIMHQKARGIGEHRIAWDGLTDSGARLKNGMYMIQISDGKTATTRRLVFMK